MEQDLTTGSVFKRIVYFSLPYLLSYFLQTLYGMADLFITGQFYGVDTITAVSNGSQIMHMMTVIIVGLAMGTTVTIGHSVGAKCMEQAEKIIGNTITLFMGIAVAFTVILVVLVKPIVVLIATPQEAVAGTSVYLLICFIGIPFITAYNIISSIFRGLGDSKSPMYFIGIACVMNIALDYLFMGAFHMGAAGAALGTVCAQTFSVLVALWVIRRRKTGISLKKSDFKIERAVIGQVLKIGIPVALQDGFIQVAFMIITVIANSRGVSDAAAVGVVEKVISALFIVPSSMLATVSALSAQNLGAGKEKRATDTLRYCCRAYTVYRGKCSWYFYIGYDRSYHGKCLYPFLYLGLHLCGNPFQLQRLFCGMWKVLYWISAQYNFDYICACSGFVSGIEIFYRYAVSNGTCGTGGVTGIRGNLCDCIYIVKEKKPCGTDSMNQDGKSFNR